jgi:hypothetical protein
VGPKTRFFEVSKRRARLNCIHHLLKQIHYKEVPREPVELPKRQKPRGYVDPSYPWRYVPERYFRPAIPWRGSFWANTPPRSARTRNSSRRNGRRAVAWIRLHHQPAWLDLQLRCAGGTRPCSCTHLCPPSWL